ncbi:MAG: SDR family oxidoreductase [Robiginitomaculum sp.]|nr:SDR family oxidoreductase [Robiginitomaculum sp.]
MRVLITGGYGFIGNVVCARLLRDGHEVVGAGRKVKWARKRYPNISWVHCDFNTDHDQKHWLPKLEKIDAVINCVGVLQDGGSDSTQNAHVTGLQALLTACEQAGVTKFIHFSAIGADPAANTAYARTKAAGAKLVKQSKLKWCILEPSLVLDRNVYGGSAVIRALAGLPLVVPLVFGNTNFQPVHMRDVTKIVSNLLEISAPVNIQMEVAGPDRMNLKQIVLLVRNWLGFGSAKFVDIPYWLVAPVFWGGDLLGKLGVRNSLRSTAAKQMRFDVGGDPEQAVKNLGYQTRSVEYLFAHQPASSADRLASRLKSFLPVSRIVLALYWILSGLIPLFISKQWSHKILEQAGFPETWHWTIWLFGGLADVILGVALLIGFRVRLVCMAMILMTVGYIGAISFLLPYLWIDPLATVLKVFPMMALAFLVAVMSDDR